MLHPNVACSGYATSGGEPSYSTMPSWHSPRRRCGRRASGAPLSQLEPACPTRSRPNMHAGDDITIARRARAGTRPLPPARHPARPPRDPRPVDPPAGAVCARPAGGAAALQVLERCAQTHAHVLSCAEVQVPVLLPGVRVGGVRLGSRARQLDRALQYMRQSVSKMLRREAYEPAASPSAMIRRPGDIDEGL